MTLPWWLIHFCRIISAPAGLFGALPSPCDSGEGEDSGRSNLTVMRIVLLPVFKNNFIPPPLGPSPSEPCAGTAAPAASVAIASEAAFAFPLAAALALTMPLGFEAFFDFGGCSGSA